MTSPDKTHAIVVGVENYPLLDNWDLKGPASDALDCIDWLYTNNVPRANIHLLLSPTDERKEAVITRAANLGFTSEQIAGATLANVTQTFKNIERTNGEFLVVFWGGHGFVDILSQRSMICADATKKDFECFNLDIARLRLTCDVTKGFARQIFIVDACGDFYEVAKLEQNVNITVPTGLTRRKYVEQATVFACQSGESAAQNQARGYGEFSRVIITELINSAHTLPPDMDLIAQRVKEHFETIQPDPSKGQRPVYCSVQGFDQDTDEIWKDANAGAQPEAAMTLLQRGRLHAAFAEYEGLKTEAQLTIMITNVFPGRTSPARSTQIDEDLKHCLVDVEAKQLFTGLFDWLDHDSANAPDSRRLHVIELKSMYGNIIEANKIRSRLKNLELRSPAVSRAFRQTTTKLHSEVIPEELAHALELLLSQKSGAAELLLGWFVLRLERECRGDEKVDAGLLDSLSVDQAKALHIRETLQSHNAPCTRLLVDFYGTDRSTSDRGWPTSLRASLQQADGTWSPFREVASEATSDGAKEAFNKLVKWALGHTDDELSVEIVVPRCLFGNNFDAWEVEQNEFALPSAIGKDNALVLRWGERFHIESLRRSWRKKSKAVAEALENTQAEIHWVPEVEENDAEAIKAISSNVKTSTDTHCVGFEFAPPEAPVDLRYDPLVAALQTGMSYALWFRDGTCDIDELKNSARAQLLRNGVERFPAALKTLRAEPNPGEEELSTRLVALWDDPFDLPPAGNVREPR